jgi:hypothetical protein
MAKMKVNDFIRMLKKAYNSKTLYVMGGWGFPLNSENKKRTFTQPYNCKPERKVKINAASSDTFAFDCCGLPRSILWGWNADTKARNGGATYCANGVPEYDAKQFMFEGCTEQSRDFSKIEPGEFLWLDGHCGVYLGDGLAIESTPKWKDGVQITAVANIGKKKGYESRTWTYHGHLKYVDYSGVQPTPTPTEYVVGKDYKVICKDTLNVRADASVSARKITELMPQTTITCREVKKDKSGNTWIKIDGWIAAKYNGDTYVG